MANTSYLRYTVEPWVRSHLEARFKQPFSSRVLPLSPRGSHEFDAVSNDGKVVVAIKRRTGLTSGGTRPPGKIETSLSYGSVNVATGLGTRPTSNSWAWPTAASESTSSPRVRGRSAVWSTYPSSSSWDCRPFLILDVWRLPGPWQTLRGVSVETAGRDAAVETAWPDICDDDTSGRHGNAATHCDAGQQLRSSADEAVISDLDRQVDVGKEPAADVSRVRRGHDQHVGPDEATFTNRHRTAPLDPQPSIDDGARADS